APVGPNAGGRPWLPWGAEQGEGDDVGPRNQLGRPPTARPDVSHHRSRVGGQVVLKNRDRALDGLHAAPPPAIGMVGTLSTRWGRPALPDPECAVPLGKMIGFSAE